MHVPEVPAGVARAADWSWRLLAITVALAACLALLWYLKVIVLPAIVALTIAPALMPLARVLRERIGRPAAAITVIVALLVIAGLVALVTTSIARDYGELAASVSRAVDELTGVLEGEPFNLSLERVRDLDASLGTAWNAASGYLVAGLRASVGLITGLVLGVALLYFILRDGPMVWSAIVSRFGRGNRIAVDRAGVRAWSALGGYVRGTALIALIDAVLIGLGLWILGVPLAFPLAVLVFLGGFVPFVGATVTGLIAVLVAYADEGWVTALIALGIVLGVQFVEGNFLQPVIQSRTVDLHPAVILLAVAAGGSLFGIIGAFLAVPVTAVVVVSVSALREESQPALVGADLEGLSPPREPGAGPG
jgi:predicted PurR-regulated permease PerM